MIFLVLSFFFLASFEKPPLLYGSGHGILFFKAIPHLHCYGNAIRPFFFFFAFVPEIGILSVRFTARPWISTYLYPWRNAYLFSSGVSGDTAAPFKPEPKDKPVMD